MWNGFPDFGSVLFPSYVGLVLEEVRTDYARMRLPHQRQLEQPAGFLHGGAIATLIDTVVVPAIGSIHDERRMLLTLDMHVSFLEAITGEDAIAEGWVEKRGRSTAFCRVEVRSASGMLASTAALLYKISSRSLHFPQT